MPFKLYDYVNLSGINEFKKWTEDLEKVQRAKLNEKLDKLSQHGDELFPQMLTNSSVAGILKLRARGNVQLRPLLCRGPCNIHAEYTLLMGAKEIGNKWAPPGAPDLANSRKQEVLASPNARRKDHERIS